MQGRGLACPSTWRMYICVGLPEQYAAQSFIKDASYTLLGFFSTLQVAPFTFFPPLHQHLHSAGQRKIKRGSKMHGWTLPLPSITQHISSRASCAWHNSQHLTESKPVQKGSRTLFWFIWFIWFILVYFGLFGCCCYMAWSKGLSCSWSCIPTLPPGPMCTTLPRGDAVFKRAQGMGFVRAGLDWSVTCDSL